ncbi:hypothetical protein BGZ76_003745 [Entomortierella beljakovae]|nr:hypothetical protein BGZ76_003745 [Entomortierella beljakovae]
MLLLVPSQKTSDDDNVPLKQYTKNLDSKYNSSQKVLVVLPPRVDLSSDVIVSDSTIPTPTPTLNLSCPQKPESGRRVRASGMVSSSSSSPPSPLNQLRGTAMTHHSLDDSQQLQQPWPMSISKAAYTTNNRRQSEASILWEQHLTFLDQLGLRQKTCYSQFPLRRHSHFGYTPDENSNSSHNRNDKSAQQLNTRRVSLPVISSQQQQGRLGRSLPRSCRSRSRSPIHKLHSVDVPYSTRKPSRILREAFKKAMTVRSPVLTSTSSGMGTISEMSASMMLPVPVVQSTSPSPPEISKSSDVVIKTGKKGSNEDLSTKVVEREDSPIDIQMNPDPKIKIKKEPTEDPVGGLIPIDHDDSDNDITILEDLSSESSLAVISSTTTSIDITAIRSTTQESSLSRSPSRSPLVLMSPTPTSSCQPQFEQHVTAHDISMMTASFGALTPQEIQCRIYAKQHQQRRPKSKRFSRRKTIPEMMSNPFSLHGVSISGPINDFRSLAQRHQFCSNQGRVEHSVHPFDKPPSHPLTLGLSITGLGTMSLGFEPHLDKSDKSGSNLIGGAPRPIPSHYYLPPSAFRTAADVAAEVQKEKEKKRQEIDQEFEEYLVFSSPSLS